MSSNVTTVLPTNALEYELLLLMSRIADAAFGLMTAITVETKGLRIRRFEISFPADTAPNPLADRLINLWGKPVHIRYEQTVPGEFRLAAQVERENEDVY